MSHRRIIWLTVALLLCIATYVGVFASWWLQSPSRLEMWQGKQVRVVEFQFNAISWHTEPLWTPAFWFVEEICGYEPGPYAAMEELSVQFYARTSR